MLTFAREGRVRIFLSIRLCLGDPLSFGDGTSRGLRFRGLATGAGDVIDSVLIPAKRFSFFADLLDEEPGFDCRTFDRWIATGDTLGRMGEGDTMTRPAEISVRESDDESLSGARAGVRGSNPAPVEAGTMAIDRLPYVVTLRVCIVVEKQAQNGLLFDTHPCHVTKHLTNHVTCQSLDFLHHELVFVSRAEDPSNGPSNKASFYPYPIKMERISSEFTTLQQLLSKHFR